MSGITNNKRNVSLSARDSKVNERQHVQATVLYNEVFPSRRFILCIAVVVSVKYFLFVMSDEGSQPAAAAAAASSDHQQVPAEVPDYVGKSTHVTSHSEPIPCSDPKICQFFTHHQNKHGARHLLQLSEQRSRSRPSHSSPWGHGHVSRLGWQADRLHRSPS